MIVKAIRRFTVRTVLPESLSALEELATNLRWSWHVPTRQLFERISPETWDAIGHDPIGLLGAVALGYGLPLASEGVQAAGAAVEAAAFVMIFLTAAAMLLMALVALGLMPEKPLRGHPEAPVLAD